MTVLPRPLDELQCAPQMATLSTLSAAIQAVCVTLDLTHPVLLSRPSACSLDAVALLLRLHLDECQEILRGYDELFFDQYGDTDDPEPDDPEPDDDIPF